MWYGLATQSLKDFGDKVANEKRNESNKERIADHVAEAALERAKLAAIKLNNRGTEMVPGFGLKRDYRKDFEC